MRGSAARACAAAEFASSASHGTLRAARRKNRYRPTVMGSDGLRIKLSHGAVVVLDREQVAEVVDTLWTISAMPGAVACVGTLDYHRQLPPLLCRQVDLTAREEAAFLEAASRVLAA